MKKSVIILLIFLILFSFTCFGTAENYEDMSIEDLIELRDEINGIIALRIPFSEYAIYSGNYLVGKDIKPGEYVIEFVKKSDINRDITISLYENQDAYDNYVKLFNKITGDISIPYHLDLEDGMILCLDGCIAALFPVNKPNWAP